MTVVSPTFRNDYIGSNITGPYAFTFKVFAATDLSVVVTNAAGAETLLSHPADYTVVGAGGRLGGTITLTTALVAGSSMTITRNTPLVQARSIRNQSAYFPDVLEDMIDTTVMIDQEQQDQIDRSIKLPVGVVGTSATEIASFLPSKYLRVNASATGIEGVDVVASSETFLQSGTGAVQRTMLSKAAERLTVADFGAVGDGSTDCAAAFTAANAARVAAGGAVSWTAGTYKIASSLTLAAPVQADTGAKIRPAAGVTVALTGQFIGDLSQHFDLSLGGAVTIASFSTDRVFPQWWGGTWNGIADDHAALQSAINAIDTSGGKGGVVSLPPCGVGLGTVGVVGRTNVQIQGAGRRSTFLNYAGSGVAVDFPDQSLSGISGVRIYPGTSSTATALRVYANTNSCLGLVFDDLEFFAASIAGQTGILEQTTGSNIISECEWSRINLDSFDRSIYQRGPEGNRWLGVQISRFGTSGGSNIGWDAGTNANVVVGRISGTGPGVTGQVGMKQGGARNHVTMVCDHGGAGAVLDTGTYNTFDLLRPEGATPIGTITSTTLLIDAAVSTLPRIRAAGTPLVAADFALSAGWGTTATVSSVLGTDQRFSLTVNSNGTGQSANPTITLTWKDGAWPAAPFVLVTRNGGNQITAQVVALPTSINTTSVQLLFVGTPVNGESYIVSGLVIG